MPCPSTGPRMFCAFFLPYQKLKSILCATTNQIVQAKKLNLLDRWKSSSGLAKNIWTNPKYFRTCRRTRYYLDTMKGQFSKISTYVVYSKMNQKLHDENSLSSNHCS